MFFKITSVVLVLLFMVVAGCGTRVQYLKVPPSKILAPLPPQMEEDQFQYKVLKSGQAWTAGSGGGVCFDRLNYESFKVHLRAIKLWMETTYKVIDQHNAYVDKVMEENAGIQKKGWFW